MDSDIGINILISAAFWFTKYKWPDMPKRVADAGIIACVLLIIAGAMEPSMKPTLIPSSIFIVCALGMGYAVHLWQKQKPTTAAADNCSLGSGNTFVTPDGLPCRVGDGNTIVRTNDGSGNSLMNMGGTAIGKNACADPTTVAVGDGANAGACVKK